MLTRTGRCGTSGTRDLIAEHAGTSRCYRDEVPFEETLRRHATEGDVAHGFGEAEMRSWWPDRDPLTGIDERTLDAACTTQQALATVLRDCGRGCGPRTEGPGTQASETSSW